MRFNLPGTGTGTSDCDCLCSGVSFPTVGVGCGDCVTAPLEYTFEIAGVTVGPGCASGQPTGCLNYNGTIVVTFVGGCIWKSPDLEACNQDDLETYRLTMGFILVLSLWHVTAGPSFGVDIDKQWESDTGFDCLGTVVLEEVTSTEASCADYPTTVTVSPVGI